ncbi:hypothetical protein ACTXT7_016052 [Hymenolepis weldensis]
MPDNATPHTSRATKNLVEEFGREVMHLMHPPPYSPVLLFHQPIFIFSGAYRTELLLQADIRNLLKKVLRTTLIISNCRCLRMAIGCTYTSIVCANLDHSELVAAPISASNLASRKPIHMQMTIHMAFPCAGID